jgi:hypothetical protein
LIHQAVTLTCASCPLLGSSEGISGIVLLLESLPFAELILPLNDNADAHRVNKYLCVYSIRNFD